MPAPVWQQKTRQLLAEGFGVEDIALKLSVAAADVRFMVQLMRGNGTLQKLYEVQK